MKLINPYGIPQIDPVPDNITDGITKWIRFSEIGAYKGDRSKTGVHFYEDDYRFERVWDYPDGYLVDLQGFKAVLSPDFSMYTNHPVAIQIHNHYRNHLVGAYWQECGITVIPSIGWVTPKSYEWCFDGVPLCSIVSISSLGCGVNPETRKGFYDGCREFIARCQPSKILWFGELPYDELANYTTIIKCETQYTKRLADVRQTYKAKRSGEHE